MNQDWRGAILTSGAGGAGGGHGGNVGSHNYTRETHTNSHNNNSVRQRVLGDNYSGPSTDQGDKYNGTINNSAVGGRGNSNELHNNGISGTGEQKMSAREMELNDRLNKARERLAAKKERERLERLEAELEELEAQL